jgi:hypothetical protein
MKGMSNEPPPTSKRWHPLQWVVVAVIVLIGIVLCIPLYNVKSPRGHLMPATNNARQIVLLLRNYASDHGGRYPPGKTSNEVFRALIKSALLPNERLFTADYSPFKGDNDVGDEPDFANALLHGENHWAMVGGLDDKSSDSAPLVFENPAEASWPPKWNMDAAATPVRGRAWKSSKIVICRNDISVAAEDLEAKTGARVGLKKNADGKDIFTQFSPTGVILDIEP